MNTRSKLPVSHCNLLHPQSVCACVLWVHSACTCVCVCVWHTTRPHSACTHTHSHIHAHAYTHIRTCTHTRSVRPVQGGGGHICSRRRALASSHAATDPKHRTGRCVRAAHHRVSLTVPRGDLQPATWVWASSPQSARHHAQKPQPHRPHVSAKHPLQSIGVEAMPLVILVASTLACCLS
jgi:hypothetical protein